MNFEISDQRLYKSHLATRFACSTRTIYNRWKQGKLPPPSRDECGRPFNYASEIAEHEATLASTRPQTKQPQWSSGNANGDARESERPVRARKKTTNRR